MTSFLPLIRDFLSEISSKRILNRRKTYSKRFYSFVFVKDACFSLINQLIGPEKFDDATWETLVDKYRDMNDRRIEL